jgi:hypothetical protein
MNGVGAIFYNGKPKQVSSSVNGLGTIGRRDAEDEREGERSRWYGWHRDSDEEGSRWGRWHRDSDEERSQRREESEPVEGDTI